MSIQTLLVRFAEHFVFDEAEVVLTFDGSEVPIKEANRELLGFFLRRPGKLIRYHEFRAVSAALDNRQAIRTRVSRLNTLLREHQEIEYFDTERGVGYRFIPEVTAEPRTHAGDQPPPFGTAEAALRSLGEPTAAELKSAIEEAIAPSWWGAKGFGHRMVRQLFKTSLTIAKSFGLDQQPAIRGLWLCALIGAQYREALNYGDELERRAQTELDQALATGSIGSALFYIGELAECIELLNRRRIAQLWDKYPKRGEWIGHMGHAALAQLITGEWESAERCIQRCHDLGDKPHFSAKAHGMLFDTHLSYFRGDDAATIMQKAQATRESAQGKIVFYDAMGQAYEGWATGGESGLDEFREGKKRLLDSHSQVALTLVLGTEAQLAGTLGHQDEGLQLIEDAMAFADSRNEEFYRAELFRLRGDLHVASGDSLEAQTSYLRSIECARSQGAIWWALRSASSLLRVLDTEQNKKVHADIVGQWPDGADKVPATVR